MTAPAVKQAHVSEASAGAAGSDLVRALMQQNQTLLSQSQDVMSKFQVLMETTQNQNGQVQSLQAAQSTSAHSSE